MANPTKGPDAPDGTSTHTSATRVVVPPPPPPPPRLEPQPVLNTPIVFRAVRRKKRREGRKRYSRGTRQSQRFLFGLSRAAFRTANAMSKGLDTYTRRSEKSMRRKRDGMVKDFLRNTSRGFADAAEEFGRAPEEIAWRISTKNVRRTFRFLTPIRVD
jgi:type IV secretory pathway VirB10-like protein